MQPIPLPPFALPLIGAALGVFVVSAGLLLLLGKERDGDPSPGLALMPFLIPVGVIAFVVLVVSGIGIILLTVGKGIAVPLALAIALGVLLVCSLLSARPSPTMDRTH